MHLPHALHDALLIPALFILAWLIALAWLYKLIEAAFGLPRVPNLATPQYDRAPATNPSLTVIVPARNEAAAISACLQSLLAQDYPNLQILAVDDRSTDSTGALMDSLARAHPTRLTVLHITQLPPNYLGKTHAMALAARHALATTAPPSFLLFTDADILFDPSILRRALAFAEASHAAHLVTLPTTIARSPGEPMLLAFLQTMSLWALRPWRVPDPRASRDAVGVGAFNLIRSSTYLQLGGFEAAPLEILEDLALGRRVKAAHLPQRVAFAPEMVSVHWAPGVFGVLHNMTKNVFAVFRFNPFLLLGAALWLTLFCVVPVAFLALPGTRIPAVLTFAAAAGLYLLSSRTSRLSPWNAVFLPIAATLVVYSMLRSMLITLARGGVTWRGTFYPLATLRRPPR